VTLLVTNRQPIVGKIKIAPIHPPDVFPRGVDQLELEIVGQRVAAHREGESVILRRVEIDRATHHHETGARAKIKIKPQTLPVNTRRRLYRRDHPVAGPHRPRIKPLEVIHKRGTSRPGRRAARQQARGCGKHSIPLTPRGLKVHRFVGHWTTRQSEMPVVIAIPGKVIAELTVGRPRWARRSRAMIRAAPVRKRTCTTRVQEPTTLLKRGTNSPRPPKQDAPRAQVNPDHAAREYPRKLMPSAANAGRA
jgi:hypothetical protein